MQKRGLLLLLLIVFSCFLVFAQEAWDEDSDGFCSYMAPGCPDELDCNDNNPLINPNATEVENGLDDDCNGLVDDINVLCADSDYDGYKVVVDGTSEDCGELDCDDSSAYINPGATEICDDGIDNDCDGLIDIEDPDCILEENLCQITADFTGVFGCETFPEKITTAHEGDTVWLILWTDNCDEESEVVFDLYEYSEGAEPYLVDSFEANFSVMNIDYGDGPTNEDVWMSPWVAEYMVDDDNSDPEYYFEAKMIDSQGVETVANSGMALDEMLTVIPCPDGSDECPVECAGLGSEFGGGEDYLQDCDPDSVDCTNAEWSECDPVTETKTRDVTKCQIYGVEEECFPDVWELLPSEKPCTPIERPKTTTVQEEVSVCGDGICEADEDEDSCPEDCMEEEEGTSWWIFVLILLLILGLGAAFYFFKDKILKKPEEKEEKPAKKLFATDKDLQAVLKYIDAARGKGYTDAQINVMLTKGGWKPDQIKFAFAKLGKPKKPASPFKSKNDEKVVLEYVKNAKAKGYSDAQIKQALQKGGRTKEQIKYILEKTK